MERNGRQMIDNDEKDNRESDQNSAGSPLHSGNRPIMQKTHEADSLQALKYLYLHINTSQSLVAIFSWNWRWVFPFIIIYHLICSLWILLYLQSYSTWKIWYCQGNTQWKGGRSLSSVICKGAAPPLLSAPQNNEIGDSSDSWCNLQDNTPQRHFSETAAQNWCN